MNRQLRILSVLLALIFCASILSCATVDIETTPSKRLAYMYQIYNAQYEDYVSMQDMPNLTDGQRQVMRTKKPILESLKLMIPAYDESVKAGAPNYQQEQEIYNFLNKLQQM